MNSVVLNLLERLNPRQNIGWESWLDCTCIGFKMFSKWSLSWVWLQMLLLIQARKFWSRVHILQVKVWDVMLLFSIWTRDHWSLQKLMFLFWQKLQRTENFRGWVPFDSSKLSTSNLLCWVTTVCGWMPSLWMMLSKWKKWRRHWIKKEKKEKKLQQGRFPTETGGTRHDVNTDSGFAGHIVDPPQSSSGHVVDPERKHSLKLSQEYASHSGIVDVNEIRTWKTDSEGNSFEVVLNEMTNVSLPILPQQKFWWRFVPLLVLSWDQGPIGTAGMAFALQGHRIHVKFDKIHRCIRDYKLALGRAMGGIFLKTQLHSSYIFGLNYKPFGTSLHFNQKRTMLELFLESQTISSPLWLEFRERIAFDLGETRVVNDRVLWDSLA